MNALERVAAVLERARIDGGWTDEVVAHRVLIALGLDEDGIRLIDWGGAPQTQGHLTTSYPRKPSNWEGESPTDQEPTSSNLGHG